MTDPINAIAHRISALRERLEHPALTADLTVGYYAEATDLETLATRMEASIRDIARDEEREIVSIEFGGVLRTDDGLRCWGTVTMAGIGVKA